MLEFVIAVHAVLGLLCLMAVVLGVLQLGVARALGGPILLLCVIVLIAGSGVCLDSVLQIRSLLGFGGGPPSLGPETVVPRLIGIAAAGAVVLMFIRGGLEQEHELRQGIARDLQDSRTRAQDFADASAQWFWETDAEHRYTWISARYEEHVEGRREWLYGQVRTDVGRPQDPDPDWERHLEDIAARRPFRDVTFYKLGPSGQDIWIRSSGVPVYDSEGVFRGYRGTGSNITEIIEAQRTASESRERLRQAVDHMVDGLALFDRDGILVLSNDRYSDLSDPFAAGLKPGSTYDEVIDLAARNVLPAETTAEEREAWRRQRQNLYRRPGSTMEFEIRGRRWIRIREQRFPDGTIAVLRTDITELKQRQFRLERERYRAEDANRAKTEFLTNMSHELRTPLNAIIGFSEVMQRQMFGELSPRYRDYATSIGESGHHLLSLISDLLDISKIEAGRFDLDEQLIDPESLLTECMTAVSPLSAAKEHELSRVGTLEQVGLWADRRAVKQIVMNLLSNAIKFTPAGGHIVLDCAVSGSDLTMAVLDNGVGIPSEDRERVFEPFSQSGNAMTRTEGGTGIGLPLSRALAEIHGGTLSLEDRETGGTRAALFLPGRVRSNDGEI